MAESKESRTDKFLWSVRLYKTRALATEACKKGRIIIEGIPVKPSRIIKTGDLITVTKPPVQYRYQVVSLPHSRVSARLVQDYILDLTPAGELKKLELGDSFFIKRERGTGRPTKKERREMDKLKGV
ncbi:MAG: RNA-binding S4 domain-containing protein [Bacteroidales bacterium]|nr:RNA-binding S4 domain-containing protein [Bacteroidales bacterium]